MDILENVTRNFDNFVGILWDQKREQEIIINVA